MNEELELLRHLDEFAEKYPELYAEVVLGAKKGIPKQVEQKSRCKCES